MRLKVVLLTMVLVLGSGAAAWAADMCFTDHAGDLFVAKNFVLPAAGQCRAYDGYFANTSWPLSGVVCGTSDNREIRFSLQYSGRNDAGTAFVYHAVAELTRSTSSGQVEYLFGPTIGNSGTFAFGKIACPVSRPLD